MSIAVPPVIRRWLVPTSAALAVVAGGVAVGLVTAAADNALPQRSAEDLLTEMLNARPDGLQGTVAVRADLGLPPLPIPTPGSADLGSLASGTHTLRVWYAGPDHARLAVLGREGETDIITNGKDLWVWRSKDNTAEHTTVGGGAGGLPRLPGLPGLPGGAPPIPGATPPALPGGLDPASMVPMLLRLLEPYTQVTTDTTASVAGRSAYGIVLRPKDTGTLIDSIELDIDAEQHFPLRFAVRATGVAAPVIEVAFTSVSFEQPDASQFNFNPPPGATVQEKVRPTEPAPPAEPGHPDGDHGDQGHDAGPSPRFALVGRGWSTVLVLGVPDLPEDSDTAGLLAALPTVSGAWGSGRLLSTRLLSVLLTDDGRLLVGAVRPEQLYAAAADPAADLGR